MPMPVAPPCEPFFLAAARGERFCIHHPPAGRPRGAVLYVHPFGEEMNKSRRTVALQARALAARGFGVLQIDLLGCGDSSGDLSEATWDAWKDDVALGWRWLVERGYAEVSTPRASPADGHGPAAAAPAALSESGGLWLWGLRLGALLALDAAPSLTPQPAGCILWQPVADGGTMVAQFLRLRLAGEMLAGTRAENGMAALRQQLDAGSTLEIAGYPLPGALVAQLDALKLSSLSARVPAGAPIHWFEVIGEPGRDASPVAQRIAGAWRAEGSNVRLDAIVGPPFWNTLEIAEAPLLVEATTAVLAGVPLRTATATDTLAGATA